MSRIGCLLFIAISLANSAPLEPAKRTPTLLISLDGFRSISLEEFLIDNPDSNLKKQFVDVGVKAEYMKPSFPTLTFPNHFTIVTGLYMESHGVVGNAFYDPNADKKVNFLSGSDSLEPRWWDKAEPIWLTAKDQGLKTSSFFWTGSEVWSRHPDYFMSYTNFYQFDERCREVLSWFTKFDMDFVTLYFNEPDHTGHSYGADSKEYRQAIKDIDGTIGYLMKLFREVDLLEKLNIIIVSDHGMADMKNKTLIVYDYVDRTLINATKSLFGIVSNIYPVNDEAAPKVYEALSKVPNLRVFYKHELPEGFHYQASERIAPIVAVADEGYVMNTQTQTLKGNHGFDNEVDAMKAIFLARGPDFKVNHKIDAIKNVDVYPMLCEILKINCNPHNGTLSATSSAFKDGFLPRTKLNF